jgi:hypothetical protein
VIKDIQRKIIKLTYQLAAIKNLGDHDESDDGFIDQFENPFQRRE